MTTTGDTPHPSWVQGTFTPPPTITLTLRCGVIPAENHAQWQYEIRDAETDVLLAMTSVHHHHDAELEDQLRLALAAALQDLEALMDPFGR